MTVRELSPAEIADLVQAYTGTTTPVRALSRRFKIAEERLYVILREAKVPLRGRAFATKNTNGRTIAKVFCGQDGPKPPPTELDNAKNVLRRRGCIVYDATVVEGRAGQGFIRCDTKRLTPAQVMEMAGLA
jgi:hypothetical protein